VILRFVKAGILICGLIMVGLLIHKHQGADRAVHNRPALIQRNPAKQENWMGVYWNGQRVGFACSSIRRVGDQVEICDHSLLQLLMAGTWQRVESRSRSLTKPDLSLRSFSFQLSSADASFSVQGVVEHPHLLLTFVTGKETLRQTVALTQAPLLANAAIPSLLRKGVEVGKQYRVYIFDPATMSTNDMQVTVEGEEERICDGKAVRTFRMRQSFKGLESVTWSTPEGVTVFEESPFGFTFKKEDRHTALTEKLSNQPGDDLLASAAVSANRHIAHPAAITCLKIRLQNVPLDGLDLDGGRQQLQGNFLIIQQEETEGCSSYPLPCSRDDMQEFLEADLLIQSDHPRIRQQAQKILSGTQDAVASVRLLLHWIDREIRKRPLVSVPSALEVLDLKTGDCNEHTVLFTALARSCGLPTRVCTGLVYLNDRFYYHAWSEVFLGAWIAVDPTLNQFPADATHVRLLIGDLGDQITVLRLVGRVAIDIAEYS